MSLFFFSLATGRNKAYFMNFWEKESKYPFCDQDKFKDKKQNKQWLILVFALDLATTTNSFGTFFSYAL